MPTKRPSRARPDRPTSGADDLAGNEAAGPADVNLASDAAPAEAVPAAVAGPGRSPSCTDAPAAPSEPAAPAGPPAFPGPPPDELAEYTDLSYRDQFWAAREYEDQCDRVAIRALLPPSGEAILDLGAGFGRLADEYLAYHRVVLLDVSETLLAAAREKLAGDERIEFVLGDAHHLPFANGSFDAATCIRVLVHVRDPRPVLAELARVVRPGGTVVIEFANRRHLLAVVRHLARRQDWSPFDPAPHEYKPLHFAHQPKTIRRMATTAGFRVSAERTVSLFRTPAISRRVAVPTLIRIERPLQTLLSPFRPGPSTYLRLIRG